MKTVTLQPAADVNAFWQQIPNDGLAHYLKVDEGFASQDGNSTYLFDTGAASFERLRFDSLPADLKTSSSVRVRGYAEAQDAGTTLGLQFFVNGVGYQAPVGWDFSTLPLNQWVALNDIVSNFPILHGGETIDVEFVSFAGVGEIRLTQIELVIDYLPHPDRFDATCESNSPATSITGSTMEGRGVSGAPEADGAVGAPRSSASGSALTAIPARVYLSGDPAAQAPMATLANLYRLTAKPSSSAPEASGVSSALKATGVVVPPEGESE